MVRYHGDTDVPQTMLSGDIVLDRMVVVARLCRASVEVEARLGWRSIPIDPQRILWPGATCRCIRDSCGRGQPVDVYLKSPNSIGRLQHKHNPFAALPHDTIGLSRVIIRR